MQSGGYALYIVMHKISPFMHDLTHKNAKWDFCKSCLIPWDVVILFAVRVVVVVPYVVSYPKLAENGGICADWQSKGQGFESPMLHH